MQQQVRTMLLRRGAGHAHASPVFLLSVRRASDKPPPKIDEYGGKNPNDPRRASTYGAGQRSAIPDNVWTASSGAATESVSQDKRAPETSAERKAWLKKETAGWTPPQKGDTFADHKKRANIVHVNFFNEPDVTEADRKEEAWLQKRQRELDKNSDVVFVGSGLLIGMYFVYVIYCSVTRKADEHPAKNCYIGEMVELTLSVDGQVFKEPVVVGLFTQRAPAACENFRRLATGDNTKGLSLTDLPFFRIESHALYGGVEEGKDARGGVIALDGLGARLPQEDSELPPFRYALTSCKRAFYSNAGFDSTFAILTSDNPPSLGYKQYTQEFDRVSSERSVGTFFGFLTGSVSESSRHEFYPPEDGAYVFGTIVEGTQVIDKIMSMVRPKQPHFKPLSDIKIERSELTAANLPGRKEKMINRAEEEDDVKRALLQRLDGKAAVATEED